MPYPILICLMSLNRRYCISVGCRNQFFFFLKDKYILKNKINLSSFVQNITEFGVIFNNIVYISSLFCKSKLKYLMLGVDSRRSERGEAAVQGGAGEPAGA